MGLVMSLMCFVDQSPAGSHHILISLGLHVPPTHPPSILSSIRLPTLACFLCRLIDISGLLKVILIVMSFSTAPNTPIISHISFQDMLAVWSTSGDLVQKCLGRNVQWVEQVSESNRASKVCIAVQLPSAVDRVGAVHPFADMLTAL